MVEGAWIKLHSMYEKETVSNKVFLIKILSNLKTHKGSFMIEHLNKFNVLCSQLVSMKVTLEDEIKALLLLCLLPDIWDNLIVAISSSAPGGTIKFDDVVGSLLNEELRRKSSGVMRTNDALYTQERGRKALKGSYQRGSNRSKSRT
eukprot:c43068_g1_i1 orf=258-698(-)